VSITQFDRPILRALRSDIEAALKAVAAKHGISLNAGGLSFEPQRFSMKLEGAVIGADGNDASSEAASFTRFAAAFGFAPGDLGKRIMLGGKLFTIIGLRPNAPKRPVLLEDANGRRNIVASANSVLLALKAQKAAG
jgi:hypothetical protein